MSAREVAGQLGGGLTRNAVIGKVHRLGLSGAGGAQSQPRRVRPKRPAHPRGRIARPRPLPPTPAAPRMARPVPEVPEGPGLVASVLGLNSHVCRWPIGDPKAPGFSFCGRSVEGQGPYCPGHARRACQPGGAVPLSQDLAVRRLLAA